MANVPDNSSDGRVGSQVKQIRTTTEGSTSPEPIGHSEADVQHVETAAVPGADIWLDDEMATAIKMSNLSLTSFASLQLYLFFFIAYCSKSVVYFPFSLMDLDRAHSGAVDHFIQ